MKITLFILATFLFIISCKKEESTVSSEPEARYDKEIRFQLGAVISTSEQDTAIWSMDTGPVGIDRFNIGNYDLIDSVVFVVYGIETMFFGENGITDTISPLTIELYDLTHNQPIFKSRIVSDDIPNGTFSYSKNLVHCFPNEPIDIGIRMILDHKLFGFVTREYLFLYRK
jgi:hypothetical protein